MSNDAALLRQYVEERAEGPFTALVREHLNLVYSAALREMNGDGGLAEDISQAVFTELARKAPRLLGHPSLAGWLYTTVRYLSANLRRAEHHRKRREEEAQSMNELLSEDSPDAAWQQIRPVLDDALHELKAEDREAVVLRFLEDRSLREVGDRLGLNENAARMRVDRALDRLRGLLVRRGITSTASGLAAAMAVGVLTPAPTALAAAVSAAALAGGAATGSTALAFLKIMSLSKVKAGMIGTLVVAGVATPVWQQARLERAQAEIAQLQARQASLAAVPAAGEHPVEADTDRAELERLRQWKAEVQPELLRLRGMAGVARRANAEAQDLRAQLSRQADQTGTNPITGAMAEAMGQAMTLQAEERLSRMTASLRLTQEQVPAVREILMRQAQAMSAGVQQVFSGKFDKEEMTRLGRQGGNADQDIKALLTPDQKAAWQSFQQEEAAHNAALAANAELFQMQTALGLTAEQQDRAFAALYGTSYDQLTGSLKPPATNMTDAMLWTFEQKTKALESVLTPEQMATYRRQQETQAKLVKDILRKMETSKEPK